MRERPILFSGPMVRAILDGSKMQTRRILKRQPYMSNSNPPRFSDTEPGDLFICPDLAPISDKPGRVIVECESIGTYHCMGQKEFAEKHSPYGQPGDRLYVRETFAIVPRTAYLCSEGVQQVLRPDDDHDAAIFREGWTRSRSGIRWRPSIHMPRWASRINLEITGVRVERLQDISEADAKAEGVRELSLQAAERGSWWTADAIAGASLHGRTPSGGFRLLWESINGAGSWDVNPWVWVVEFKRIEAGAVKQAA